MKSLVVLRVQENPNRTKRLGMFTCPLTELRKVQPASKLTIQLDVDAFEADEQMLSFYNNHGSLIGEEVNEWINKIGLRSETKDSVLFEVETEADVDSFRLIGTEQEIVRLLKDAAARKRKPKYVILRRFIRQ